MVQLYIKWAAAIALSSSHELGELKTNRRDFQQRIGDSPCPFGSRTLAKKKVPETNKNSPAHAHLLKMEDALSRGKHANGAPDAFNLLLIEDGRQLNTSLSNYIKGVE